MLNLTRKTDYALVALAYLQQCRGEGQAALSAREIADRFGMPLPLLMNVLKDLCRARIVHSTRGAGGGYTLAAEPAQVTLLEIVTAIEGPLRLARCVNDLPAAGQECPLASRCLIEGAIQRLHQRVDRFLADMTLADLLDTHAAVVVEQVGMEALVGQ